MVVKAVPQNPLLRFLIVGGASTCVNYGIYLLLYLVVLLRYEYAFIMGFLSGVAFGYLLNRSWTFQVRSGDHKRDVWRYFIVYTASLLVGLVCMRLAVEVLDVDPRVANLCIILVTTYTNYIGIRFWVFRK
jgi:putative flippase GtrA